MIKDQKKFHSQIRKPYWGILARDQNIQNIHKPGNFMSLLKAQSEKADANAVPVPVSPKNMGAGRVSGKISGKQKSKPLSKDIPL